MCIMGDLFVIMFLNTTMSYPIKATIPGSIAGLYVRDAKTSPLSREPIALVPPQNGQYKPNNLCAGQSVSSESAFSDVIFATITSAIAASAREAFIMKNSKSFFWRLIKIPPW